MSVSPKPFPHITPVGDSALLVELGDEINPKISRWVQIMDAKIEESRFPGVLEWVPGYASMLVYYDPQTLSLADLHTWLHKIIKALSSGDIDKPGQVEIPVRYGGVDGPDLAYVAAFHGLSQAAVIERHTAPVYQVGMMGFTPGFAYLIGLDPFLATPRLATPRTLVPAGSVGIAGEQTGVYPLDSPGGWQLIGRTDRKLFTPHQEPFFLLSPGDQVRFIALQDGDHS